MQSQTYFLTIDGAEPVQIFPDFETRHHKFFYLHTQNYPSSSSSAATTAAPAPVFVPDSAPNSPSFLYTPPRVDPDADTQDEEEEEEELSQLIPIKTHRRLRSPPPPVPEDDFFEPIIASPEPPSSPDPVESPPPQRPVKRLRGPGPPPRRKVNPNNIWLTRRKRKTTKTTAANGDVEETEEVEETTECNEQTEAEYMGTHYCHVCMIYMEGKVVYCPRCRFGVCTSCRAGMRKPGCPQCFL